MCTNIDLTLMNPVLEKYEGQTDALIPVLQEVQNIYSYLPEAALAHYSDRAGIPMSRIYSVATFYAQFYLSPRGRNTIRICQGTACHVQGCEPIVSSLEEKLGIEVGGTTEDLEYSLESVACVGTCFLAPVVMINNDYHGKQDSQKVLKVLEDFEKTGRESK